MYLETLRQTGLHKVDAGEPVKVPSDLDYDKYRRGQEFFQKNLFACAYAMLTSLICGMSVENLLQPLVFTKQSDEPVKALRRYVKTFQHVGMWHFYDIFDEQSPASKSLRAVRKQHTVVRDSINASETTSFDSCQTAPHFSQYDMSLVQCGFIGAIVMYHDHGMKCTVAELDDFVYLWYCIGCFLGITDENNVCRNGFDTAWKICKEVEMDILCPVLLNPPSDYDRMSQALVDGMNLWHWFPLHSVNSFIAATPSPVAKAVHSKLTFADYLRVLYMRAVIIVVKYFAPVRYLLNKPLVHMIEAGAKQYEGSTV